jgi:hypothetical protein
MLGDNETMRIMNTSQDKDKNNSLVHNIKQRFKYFT